MVLFIKHGRTRAAALVGVLALGVGACGSSSSATHDNSGSSTLTVMQISPPVSPQLPGLNNGAQVAAASINAAGGVDGHRIRIIQCSSGAPVSDPNSTTACATQAVRDHVLATVGAFTFFTNNLYPITDAAHIPNIGVLPALPVDSHDTESFPLQPDNDTTYAGIGLMLAKAGCKTVGFVGSEQEGGVQQYAADVSAGARYGGAAVASPVMVPATQSDFASSVAVLSGRHVDCAAFGLSAPALGPFLTAVKDAGANIHVGVNVTAIPDPVLAALKGLANGVYVENILTPDQVTTTGHTRLKADFAKFGGGQSPTDLGYPGWEAVYVFRDAVKSLITAKKSITAANVTSAVGQLQINYGISPPFAFGSTPPVASRPRIFDTSVFIEQVQNGAITLLSPTPINVAPAFAS
jgi:ABC-type branched-subunit amino acid transport system substrate-binding protein